MSSDEITVHLQSLLELLNRLVVLANPDEGPSQFRIITRESGSSSLARFISDSASSGRPAPYR